jgi:hypothetical protein
LADEATKLSDQAARLEARRAERSDREVDRRLSELDALKTELRETLEGLRQAGEEAIAQRGDKLFTEVAELRKKARAAAPPLTGQRPPATSYREGDRVRIFGGRQVGVVEEVRGDRVLVRANEKILHLPAGLLEPASG